MSLRCHGVVGITQASILQPLLRLTLDQVSDRSQPALAILLEGEVGHPLYAGFFVVPSLLPAFNTGGHLNASPGYRLCPGAFRLEERRIKPGSLDTS